ncbi:PREDICTED: uncharacterized protein LOC106747301 [Dinoponera quadriceps]|uniref:Uncharacterized protein LOC106747301 n=1 Tax=Dinoponera quadriceps TaxID=609295 RepID=A0A6P3XP54_DINQU|nr:PREDICTED: uncharacterized protein LOC106747301 [Dinoponera quadriceps]
MLSVLVLTVFLSIINCSIVSVKSFDNVQFLIPDNCLSLCELLEKETTNSNGTLSNFKFSRAFNLDGKRCLIPAGNLRINVYLPPQYTSLINDIGCRKFIYEVVIEKCGNCESVGKPTNFGAYLYANIALYLQPKRCSNSLM